MPEAENKPFDPLSEATAALDYGRKETGEKEANCYFLDSIACSLIGILALQMRMDARAQEFHQLAQRDALRKLDIRPR